MTRETLFTVFFFLVFAFLLYQVYRVFSLFIAPAAWAAILALVFYPVYRAFLLRIRQPALASVAVTLLICHMVILPAFTFGSVAVTQTQELYGTIQEKVASGEVKEWIDWGRETRLARFARRVLPPETFERTNPGELALRGAQLVSGYAVGHLGGFAVNFFGFLVDFGLMVLILFFFFRDGERMYSALRGLLPMDEDHKDAIFIRFYETLSAVVQGMTITAVVQGILAAIGFAILGLPFALLLALASALASFIPFVGAALIWVPAVFYFLSQELWGRALGMLLWGSLVISLSDNFVKPIVIGSRIKMPTLFLFLGILGGLQTYGVLGVFLGPALLATIVAVFRIYKEEYAIGAPERLIVAVPAPAAERLPAVGDEGS